MQGNLEDSTPVGSGQDLYKTSDEVSLAVDRETGMNLQLLRTQAGMQSASTRQQPWRRHRQAKWRLTLMIGDIGILLALLTFTQALSFYLHFNLIMPVYTIGNKNIMPDCDLLALVLWFVTSRIAEAYQLINISDRFRSVINVQLTLVLALIPWMLLTFPFFSANAATYLKVVSVFFILAVPILSTWRALFAEVICLPRFRPRAVIVGTTAAGKVIAREISRRRRPYATIVGYISINNDTGLEQDGIPILGGLSILHHLQQSGMIDMIVMAVDYHEYPGFFQKAIEIAQPEISVVPMAVAYENVSGKIPVEHIGDQWYLALPLDVTVSPLYLCWRKVIDVTFGFIGTALLLLVLPIMALLISLDSPGPVFYSQERIGLWGKPFRIYKFRSMRTDAEDKGHAIWATESDARVTRVGRIMRAFHLDELPQVLNILKGEMSLIGPRPEREEFATELEKTIPFYRCRLTVKSGLTGWGQVKYHYGSSDNDALIKLQYDLYYIKHQSFMLDIFIILKTVAEVLLHRGT